jgi:hypothetical protein
MRSLIKIIYLIHDTLHHDFQLNNDDENIYTLFHLLTVT